MGVRPWNGGGGVDVDTTANDTTELRTNSGAGSGREPATPRVLKQRFVLEEKLGSGGMGTVYRAKDLRKVEARDRNPYLAVKVLNADFRAHPDAFIALQREASKSQAIAHRNIVSIFDFDKDGDIPYMTMELLEGSELTVLLRNHPEGIPDALAWRIIEGMCAGLTRAHEAGITHADFKPGNVFVMQDGTPKILDFGIARAVRLNQARGEHTVFDPAKLAALTPAYASKEMLDGEAPVPADDIYSFAVVAYLVLTGRHPYGRVRADEAARQGLVPERIRRINRRRWRMLARCLAFERALRPASMREVARALFEPPAVGAVGYAAIAAALVVGAASLWFVATRSERDAVAHGALAEAQANRVAELLSAPTFDPAWELKLADAMRQLASVPGSDAAMLRAASEVRAAYRKRLEAASDVAELAMLMRGAEAALGEPFHAGRSYVANRVMREIDRLSRAKRFDRVWLVEVESVVDDFAAAWPDNALAGRVAQRAVAAYVSALDSLVAAGAADDAASFLAVAWRRLPHVEVPEPVEQRLSSLQATISRQRHAASTERARVALDQELERLLAGSCDNLDPAVLKRATDRLVAAHPGEEQRIVRRAARALAACIASAGQMDLDRALRLKRSASRAFRAHPAIAGISLDACAMPYLVGRGTEPGRSGFCFDTLASGGQGPRLVVVPLGSPESGQRFAITKFEVSWQELSAYCVRAGTCASPPPQPELPAHGVGIDVARAYADWLSGETGHTYRLPTIQEWRAAAGGEADPNRNCSVQLEGVGRGNTVWPASSGRANAFGVVNVLGNVQEWVTDDERLLAAGGAHADPLERCTSEFVREHDGRPDPVTGVRLVREIR